MGSGASTPMGDGLAGPAQTAQALHRQIHGALRGLPEDTARRVAS